MFKSFLVGFFVLVTFNTFASLKTRVLHINEPEYIGDNYEIIVAKHRSVFELFPEDIDLIDKAIKAYELNATIEITTQSDQLTDIKIIDFDDDLTDFYIDEEQTPMTHYRPTTVKSKKAVGHLFGYLKYRTKWFTQCYNRAHVWARQMHKRNGIRSMKIFVFYTAKFRENIDDKWWFHVAPMVNVNGQHYVLDKEFFKTPVTDYRWEKHFTRKMHEEAPKNYRCKVITKMSEYYDRDNQRNEYCNILVSNMYYYMPLHLTNLEKHGDVKSSFSNNDLKSATKEIFWKWRRVYDQIKL